MSNNTTSVLFNELFALPSSVSSQVLPLVSVDRETLIFVWDFVLEQITFSNFWKLLLVIHLIANFKVFPFIYHLRILNAVRFLLRSQRPQEDVKPEQLFQPIITTSRSPLMESDVYGHKSNSTYFADVDVARIHLIATIFSKGIQHVRGSTTMNGLSGKETSAFRVALGAVSCHFRREILPYEQYDMWTKVLAWDDKWWYIVTHFIKKNAKVDPDEISLYPQQRKNNRKSSRTASHKSSMMPGNKEAKNTVDATKKSPVAASAVSKIVLKDGRKTIPPEHMLEISGLLPVGKGGAWNRTTMEAERRRGMALVQHLAEQNALGDDFEAGIALGRHYDGFGVEGVVTTLAKLGGFTKYQLV